MTLCSVMLTVTICNYPILQVTAVNPPLPVLFYPEINSYLQTFKTCLTSSTLIHLDSPWFMYYLWPWVDPRDPLLILWATRLQLFQRPLGVAPYLHLRREWIPTLREVGSNRAVPALRLWRNLLIGRLANPDWRRNISETLINIAQDLLFW
jgi:hypothetical protein